MGWYKCPNLVFESRPSSTEAISALFDGREAGLMSESGIECDLLTGYKIAQKALGAILKEENIKLECFVSYLLDNVYILRVEVPKDTDLNHYFEIMNSRGEQLERHEILKAQLMSVLSKMEPVGGVKTRVFGKIWDACSDMDRYLQMNFPAKEIRGLLFGELWNELKVGSFFEVSECLSRQTSDDADGMTMHIQDIIGSSIVKERTDGKEVSWSADGRFLSVINFQNFLLQVLRVFTGEDVPMDDKSLIDEFSNRLKARTDEEQARFVADFAFALLKCRFLFDKYVIKREYEAKWRVQSVKRQEKDPSKVYYVSTFGRDDELDGDEEDVQKDIEMLLAMFHVSHPTMIYKHWLNGVLRHLYAQEPRDANEYREFLEKQAECFLRCRFLAKVPSEYYDIIYKDVPPNEDKFLDISKLDQGTAVENFIFNYLDYKLWKQNRNRYPTFEFTVRSSVEHYYPQHPMDGITPLDEKTLNSFGNLCLISARRNSRLSNFSPVAKKDFYLKDSKVESIKQRLMLDYDKWSTEEIKTHGKEMREILIGTETIGQRDRDARGTDPIGGVEMVE